MTYYERTLRRDFKKKDPDFWWLVALLVIIFGLALYGDKVMHWTEIAHADEPVITEQMVQDKTKSVEEKQVQLKKDEFCLDAMKTYQQLNEKFGPNLAKTCL